MTFLPPEIQTYVTRLVRRPVEQVEVLRDMELRAQSPRFPIVGAEVGALIEILARLRGARRAFEIGSGFGYSAYFFARGMGEGAEVHLTDLDRGNLDAARDYLARAGFPARFHFHEGDALASLERELAKGPFDVYLLDADKHRYPDYWGVLRPKLRPNDLVIVDNLLWGGDVVDPKVQDAETTGLRRFTELASSDPAFRFTLLPIRDGVGLVQKL